MMRYLGTSSWLLLTLASSFPIPGSGSEVNVAEIVRSVGAQDRELTPAELTLLWKVAESEPDVRFRVLEQFLATPENAIRFQRQAAKILRATVGLNSQLRLRVAKELLAPRIAAPPANESHRSALVWAGIELELFAEVPGLPALAAGELQALLKLRKGRLDSTLSDRWSLLATSLPEAESRTLFMQLMEAAAIDREAKSGLSKAMTVLGKRLDSRQASELIVQWLSDRQGTETKLTPYALAAVASRIDDPTARQLVTRALKNIAETKDLGMDPQILDSAIGTFTPAVSQTFVDQLLATMEKSDPKVRGVLAQRLGTIPGGLTASSAKRALNLLDPSVRQQRGFSFAAMEVLAVVKNAKPDAIAEILPNVLAWRAAAENAREYEWMMMIHQETTAAIQKTSPEAATRIAKLLDQMGGKDEQVALFVYPTTIARLPKPEADRYLAQLRTSKDQRRVVCIAQGLADSTTALTSAERIDLVRFLLTHLKDLSQKPRDAQRSQATAVGIALGAACARLAEKDRFFSLKRVLKDASASGSPEMRAGYCHSVARIVQQSSREEARLAIALLADTCSGASGDDPGTIAPRLEAAINSRPDNEAALHAQSIAAALGKATPAAQPLLQSQFFALLSKVSRSDAGQLGRQVVENLAKATAPVGNVSHLPARGQPNPSKLQFDPLVAGLSVLLRKAPATERRQLIGEMTALAGRAADERVGKSAPRSPDGITNHDFLIARLAGALASVINEVPPQQAAQIVQAILDLLEQRKENSKEMHALAEALPLLCQAVPPSIAPPTQARLVAIARGMARLPQAPHASISALIESAVALPGKMNDETSAAVTDLLAASAGAEAPLSEDLAKGINAFGMEASDAQRLTIVDAVLAHIAKRRPRTEKDPVGAILISAVSSVSPDGAKQAWPKLCTALETMPSSGGTIIVAEGLATISARLPASMMPQFFEAFLKAADLQAVDALGRALLHLSNVRRSDVEPLMRKEQAGAPERQKQWITTASKEDSRRTAFDPVHQIDPQSTCAALESAAFPEPILSRLRVMYNSLNRVRYGNELSEAQLIALMKYPNMGGAAGESLIMGLRQQFSRYDLRLWDFVAKPELLSLTEEELRQPAVRLSTCKGLIPPAAP